MNETKSARYHRLRRRAGFGSLLVTVALLAALLWVPPPVSSVSLYVLLIVVLHELLASPIAFYRTFILDRRYELSQAPVATWVKDHAKGFLIAAGFAVAAAEAVYALIRWSPDRWWIAAALAASAVSILLVRIAPVVLLPLFYKFTPLDRPSLATRIMALTSRAGVRVVGVYEWGLGEKTRRANAALVGSGGTRRILVSDTLLAEYTDDEIEVVLAHELGHHVHFDIAKGLAVEVVLLFAACYAAAAALNATWWRLGLAGVADVKGLPVLILAGGAVTLLFTPALNALSRLNERRADHYALCLTERREPFISAMRRLASQNLAEENPSAAAVWLYHTHPPIEERIAAARSAR